MQMEPDTKDWTWVLHRPCPQCGFDPGTIDRANLADRLSATLQPWAAVLAAPNVRQRPRAEIWSPLEYGAHVRDVTTLMRERLALMLAEDHAQFADWDQDAAALSRDYGSEDPEVVTAGIGAGGRALVATFRAVRPDQWQREGLRSNGSRFTTVTLGVYTLHDLEHHLWDVLQTRVSTVPPNPLEQLSLAELRRRTSAKWREFGADVLPMWVAEMDVTPAEPIQRALTDAIRSGDTGYAHGTAYAEALQAFASRRWGWDGIAVERTAPVPDVMLGVVEMLRLVTGPGDCVIVNCPVYPPFYSFVRHLGRRVIEAPLGPDLRIDLGALGEAFLQARGGGRSAAYLLCSPHNPTGTVHTAVELQAVAALAGAHGVRVVADEIHAPLVLPGAEFVPYLSVPGGDDGLSLMSASKGWNLAGLKAAIAVAGPGAAADLARLPEEVGHGASHLGQIAHTAAMREGEQWLDAVITGLDANRKQLGELIAEHVPMVGYQPPQGTYLAWLDCTAIGIDEGPAAEPGLVTLSVGPAAFFLQHAKVAVSAGPAFGTGGAGHVRLNFATSRAMLAQGIGRLGQAVRTLN